MINKINNKENNKKEAGFLELIVIIIIALLLLKYFHLTISGIMAHFGITWMGILNWFKDLFNSVK